MADIQLVECLETLSLMEVITVYGKFGECTIFQEMDKQSIVTALAKNTWLIKRAKDINLNALRAFTNTYYIVGSLLSENELPVSYLHSDKLVKHLEPLDINKTIELLQKLDMYTETVYTTKERMIVLVVFHAHQIKFDPSNIGANDGMTPRRSPQQDFGELERSQLEKAVTKKITEEGNMVESDTNELSKVFGILNIVEVESLSELCRLLGMDKRYVFTTKQKLVEDIINVLSYDDKILLSANGFLHLFCEISARHKAKKEEDIAQSNRDRISKILDEHFNLFQLSWVCIRHIYKPGSKVAHIQSKVDLIKWIVADNSMFEKIMNCKDYKEILATWEAMKKINPQENKNGATLSVMEFDALTDAEVIEFAAKRKITQQKLKIFRSESNMQPIKGNIGTKSGAFVSGLRELVHHRNSTVFEKEEQHDGSVAEELNKSTTTEDIPLNIRSEKLKQFIQATCSYDTTRACLVCKPKEVEVANAHQVFQHSTGKDHAKKLLASLRQKNPYFKEKDLSNVRFSWNWFSSNGEMIQKRKTVAESGKANSGETEVSFEEALAVAQRKKQKADK
jgi:hypothetical protein